jgi:hypothetical protein
MQSGKGDVFGFIGGEFKIVGDIESSVRVRTTRGRETEHLGLKAQIRKSSEEYRCGNKRDAGIFVAELRGRPARPNTKRKTQT